MKETIEWIKVETRKPTKEEIEDWVENEEGEILIQTRWGVSSDTCMFYDGCYLDSGFSWDEVIAWARMPKGIEVEE